MHDVLVRSSVEHLLPRREFRGLADPSIHFLLRQSLKVLLVLDLEAAALQELLEGAEPRVLAHERGVEHLIEVDELRHRLMRQLIESRNLDSHTNSSLLTCM